MSVRQSGTWPEIWCTVNIVQISKSGGLTNTYNYREINLSSLVAKTFKRMRLNRMRPFLNPILSIWQKGFRQGRSTVTQIIALRRILKKKNLSAVTELLQSLIDFKKAFDSVDRRKMINILRAYGIPEKINQVVAAGYKKTRAKVLFPDIETEYIEILAGVLQCNTLPPFLLIWHCLRPETSD